MLRALELDAYRALPRHQPGFIAQRVGISLADEERYLGELLRAKQIRKNRGRFVVTRVLTVDTRMREADNLRIKGHWAEVALQRLRAGSAPARCKPPAPVEASCRIRSCTGCAHTRRDTA